MNNNINNIIASIKNAISSFEPEITSNNIGRIISCCDGIIKVQGLEKITCNQLLRITSKHNSSPKYSNSTATQPILALVMELDKAYISAVLLNGQASEGDIAEVLPGKISVDVGDSMLGRMVDFLGKPIDDKGEIITDRTMTLEADAPKILDRAPVNQPCMTGVKIIDAFIPIGKGQREMIIGDRATGKTAIALDMIINQKHDPNIICIYVAIGQRGSKIAQFKQQLEERNALNYTIIVATTSADEAIAQVLAPFTGCAIGEYFMQKGKDVIIIYDDLSKHAVSYRQISLLLRRPPGRDAYPGDIFYLHSRLLERAAKLKSELGGGSMTAIPIIETQEGNFATYIATNVWSITDGQIVLSTDLFLNERKPAIDIGMSVSRVGGAAQYPTIKNALKLKLILSQYNEFKNFAKYGADVDKQTQQFIDKGDKIMELLKQRDLQPVNLSVQTVLYEACLDNHILNDLTFAQVRKLEKIIHDLLQNDYMDLAQEINETKQSTNCTHLLQQAKKIALGL